MKNKRVGVFALAVVALGMLVYVGGGGKGLLSQVLPNTTSTSTSTSYCTEEWLSGNEANYKLVRDEKYPTVNKEIETLQGEIEQLKTLIATNIKNIAEYKNSKNSKNKEITKNKDTISNNTAKINANNAQISVLTTYIKKKCNGFGGNSSTCKKKKSEKAALEKTNVTLTADNKKLSDNNTKLGRDVESLNTKIKTLETENDGLKQKMESKDVQAQQLNNTITEYKKIMEEYESCEKILKNRLFVTSTIMPGEIPLGGEIGKRVSLFEFSMYNPGTEKAEIDEISFEVMYETGEILLSEWYVGENTSTGNIYICNNKSSLNELQCTPQDGQSGKYILESQGSEIQYVLSAKIDDIKQPGHIKITGIKEVQYNKNHTNIRNATSSVLYAFNLPGPESLGHGAAWSCQNDEYAQMYVQLCHPSSLWNKISEEFCKNACSMTTNKCGVASFEVLDSSRCGVGVCGNGVKESNEECDDGNRKDKDGCSTLCKKDENPDLCELFGTCVCGNGIVEPGEECDDGDEDNNDGCDTACKVTGSLSVTIDSSTPVSSILLDNRNEHTIAVFRLAASGAEDLDVKSIKITDDGANGDDVVGSFKFYNDSTLLGTIIPDGSGNAQLLLTSGQLVIPANGFKLVTIKTVLRDIDGTGFVNGDTLVATIAAPGDVDAIGLTSGVAIDSTQTSVDGNIMTAYEAYPITTFVTDSNIGSTITLAPNQLVAKIGLTNTGNKDVTFQSSDSSLFSIQAQITGDDTNSGNETVTLKDQNGTTLDTGTITSATGITQIDFNMSSVGATIGSTIPAGQTKYFYIYADTSDLEDAGDMIQIWLDDTAADVTFGINGSGAYAVGNIVNRGDLFGPTLINSSSAPVCGNNFKEGTEECDDGNTDNGDGCTNVCKMENTDPCITSGTCACEGTIGDITFTLDPCQTSLNLKKGEGRTSIPFAIKTSKIGSDVNQIYTWTGGIRPGMVMLSGEGAYQVKYLNDSVRFVFDDSKFGIGKYTYGIPINISIPGISNVLRIYQNVSLDVSEWVSGDYCTANLDGTTISLEPCTMNVDFEDGKGDKEVSYQMTSPTNENYFGYETKFVGFPQGMFYYSTGGYKTGRSITIKLLDQNISKGKYEGYAEILIYGGSYGSSTHRTLRLKININAF